jgi:hypothetical protein
MRLRSIQDHRHLELEVGEKKVVPDTKSPSFKVTKSLDALRIRNLVFTHIIRRTPCLNTHKPRKIQCKIKIPTNFPGTISIGM